MTTFIGFIIVLSVLVLVHELGHFWTAKKAGAKVEEFGIGFPPTLFSWRRGETKYSINIIPFGGFVKILGEDESEIKKPGSFGSLSISRRAIVLVAGVVMNFLLAVVLLTIVSGLGQVKFLDESSEGYKNLPLQIIQVMPETPATEAGLKAGDEVVSVFIGENVIEMDRASQFRDIIKKNEGEELFLNVRRGGEDLSLNITPRQNPPEGEGAVGVFVGKIGKQASPWWRAPWDGFKIAINMTLAIIMFVGKLFSGGVELSHIAGPVGIATLTGDAIRLGFTYLLNFVAFLSINLAILNILPFPALDGGRILFLFIEKIKGSPVKKSIENTINTIGFALLIVLMILVTWQDIIRFL